MTVIVFKDNSWLERHEYDLYEAWWEYKRTSILKSNPKRLKRIHGGLWITLKGLNEGR